MTLLIFGAKASTGIDDRRGTLLLDPKNITIAGSGSGSGAYNLQAMIGHGYSGGKNINQTLDTSDYFGASVSLDGNRLAVGARGDRGSGNSRSTSGAVYLYSFTDASFSGAALEAIVGHGYSGGKNVNQSLDAYDYFGWAVSLDGNRLAVGSYYADGYNNGRSGSGDVYLYTFSNSTFSGGALAGMIGHGYTGGKNINVSLGTSDVFGGGAFIGWKPVGGGAPYGDGSGNSRSGSGEIYLYTFSNSTFSGGALAGVIGHGYSPAARTSTSPWIPTTTLVGPFHWTGTVWRWDRDMPVVRAIADLVQARCISTPSRTVRSAGVNLPGG